VSEARYNGGDLQMTNQERMFFESSPNSDHNLQVVAFVGADEAEFSANDEWCGSSETGFGATITVSLDRESAARLVDMLMQWLRT